MIFPQIQTCPVVLLALLAAPPAKTPARPVKTPVIHAKAPVIPAKAPALPPIEILPTDAVARVSNEAPVVWGLSGLDMSFVRQAAGGLTPTMRTFTWDARLVQILWKAEDGEMTWKGIEAVGPNVVVRMTEHGCECKPPHLYLLMTVTTRDARASGTTPNELAKIWASSVRMVLNDVLPIPTPGV